MSGYPSLFRSRKSHSVDRSPGLHPGLSCPAPLGPFGAAACVGIDRVEDGAVSTFDVGYTAGTALLDLQLLGTTGVIGMDDFVLDWTNSFPFNNPDIQTGYAHRTGMATRKEFTFVPTPSKIPQQVLMIDAFADLAATGDAAQRARYIDASLKTQEYLDALWAAIDQ